jgi:hypothetical protein
MKKIWKKSLSVLLVAGTVLAGCNKEKEFPDFDFQTVYFAYQYPVRTVTQGEDVFNTDLDNQGKIKIMAATGGVYYAKNDVEISVEVADDLISNGMLFRAGGDLVQTMPKGYYSLAGNKIVIPRGAIAGGVDVQLSDAFFDDPLSVKNSYVIPLRMTGVTNADSILAGKNYILYAVKFVNPWHGNYLRRGRDVVTGTMNQTIVRRQQYVERDEVNKLTTIGRRRVEFPVVVKDNGGNNITVRLVLQFDDQGRCTVSAANNTFTATGSGAFVKRGEKQSWGNKDRDALYLNYQVNISGMLINTTDTLVMRDRAVTMETFTPVRP